MKYPGKAEPAFTVDWANTGITFTRKKAAQSDNVPMTHAATVNPT